MVRRFDSHVIGYMRIGYSRIGVTHPVWEKTMAYDLPVEVTRHKRVIAERQRVRTGQPVFSWTDFTIDAIITLSDSSMSHTEAGSFGDLNGKIMTADPIKLGDHISFKGVRYEVSKPMIEKRCMRGMFWYRLAGLKKLEFKPDVYRS